MAEKLITQDILAYDMGILWAIADRHKGIFSEDLVECFCRGLAAPTSLVSVCDLLIKLSGKTEGLPEAVRWGEGVVALALVAQREPLVTLNRLTILAYLSDRVVGEDLADLLLTILVLGLPAHVGVQGFERQQLQLKTADKIFSRLALPENTLEASATLMFAATPESADVVATEFANASPGSMQKAVLHDICLFSPFLTPEGLVLPASARLTPISPIGQTVQELLRVEDPFLT